MKGNTAILLLFLCGLALGADVLLWSACTDQYCAYLYETPPCGLTVKVATTSGFQLFEQPFDLAVTNEVCAPPFLGCTYCIDLQNLTKNDDGSLHPCVYLKSTCSGTTTSNNLGCVTNSNDLAQCLSQGCPNGCSSHGTCSSTGVCQCNTGWYGDDCSQQAPLFDQCITLPQYGDLCLKLETDQCAIDATVYFKALPQAPLYNRLIEAPAFNTYFQTASCFNIVPGCGACLMWNDFVLNETYAHGCPTVNATCTGLPSGVWPYDCFTDTALIPACFGTCPENCSGNGECVNGACSCNAQYKGSTCAIPSCDQLFSCFGNGECVAPNKCQCNSGYTGADCAAAVCSGDCSGHGKCIRPGECRCDANFTGSTCAQSVCPYDCKNGGQCAAGTCKCTSGWEGDDCGTKQGVTPGPSNHTPSSVYVIVGVVVGLVVAGAGAAAAFFIWRNKYRKSDRYGPVIHSDESESGLVN